MGTEDIYLFSTEGSSPDLPVKCRFVKRLDTGGPREAILTKCDKKVRRYGTDDLVLVPKHQGRSLFDEDADFVGVYIVDARVVSEGDQIDLSAGSEIVMDWGGISRSRRIAEKYQVNLDDVVASNEALKKFIPDADDDN